MADRIEQLEALDEMAEMVLRQMPAAVQYLTFLRDLAYNSERWEKYRDSFSGNVVNLQIVAVHGALLLLCDRLWDGGRKNLSLPQLLSELGRKRELLLQRRSSDADAKFEANWIQNQNERIDRIIAHGNALKNSKIRDVIRVIRTESLAHIIKESDDRARAFPEGFDGHNKTKSDLFDFAQASIDLVHEIEIVRTGCVHDFKGHMALFKKYCDAYWDSLPVFRSHENL